MGFGFVNVVDPESRIQVPIIGQFLLILATLLFLVLNGHHWLIRAIIKSIEVIPLGSVHFDPALIWRINGLFKDIFLIAFKLAAPVAMCLFLVDVAYGIISRAIPQMNILIVGFPLKIGLGLVLLVSFLPLFLVTVKGIIMKSLINLNFLFRLM
jgi:flagellar biosynthetic protein FliR